jgi:hypothetical protein
VLFKALSLHPFCQCTFQRLECLIKCRIVLQPFPNHPADIQGSDKGTAVVVISYFNIAIRLYPPGDVEIEVFKRAIHQGPSQDHLLREIMRPRKIGISWPRI